MNKSNIPQNIEELLAYGPFRDWVLNPTPEQNQWWATYLNEHPGQEDLIKTARNVLLGIQLEFQTSARSEESLKADFESLLMQADAASPSEAKIKSFRWKAVMMWAAAALLIGLIGGGLWIRQITTPQTYKTAFAEWRKVDLPDGSAVWLNAHSELRFQRGWAWGADRNVWLKGEAFFEVEKKLSSKAKFIVNAEDLKIEVYGTAFNVKARGEETEVYLKEGNIRLATPDTQTQVLPGEKLVYENSNRRILFQGKVKQSEPDSWKAGTLVLENESVRKIIQEVEIIYGFKITLADSQLLEQSTTIGIPMGSWEVAKPILERTLGTSLKTERMEQK